MQVAPTALDGVLVFTPKRHEDPRGSFIETFRQDVFGQHAPGVTFVQDNHSTSVRRGTVRGLHFQREPAAQGKLVRCARGAILDVAVDVRDGSPTYGRHVAVELTPSNLRQLWVPAGFLHGFCTSRTIPRSSTRSRATTALPMMRPSGGTTPISRSPGP